MQPQTVPLLNPDTPEKRALMMMVRWAVQSTCFCLLMLGAVAAPAQEPIHSTPKKLVSEGSPAKVAGQTVAPQKIVEQGIAIEFTIDPNDEKARSVRAGEDAIVKFKVADTTTGTPVKGLNLSVWMSLRRGDKAPDTKQCRERIQSFLGGSLRERPDVDLNSYYVLAMNESADISVIDPLLGFGGSKLLTLVMMRSPGEDWVLGQDGERIYVTLPRANQVAVIDTRTWKVLTYLDTGPKPGRIAMQPDQKYLWVANDGADSVGVTVIDAVSLKVVAHIAAGAGRHDIVFSGDNRFAFVSNQQSGTVSIIDVRKLAKIDDLKIGPAPVSMAVSGLSKAIYVGSESEGSITVIDEQSHKILGRMKARPGLRSIRFAPGGRYGFALSMRGDTVNVFDAASNRMLHEVKVGTAPDQIIFSDTFAFVRSLGTESVAMIRLATIGTDIEISEFPGGQAAPGKASPPARADSMVLAPEGNSVIVANPADKILYYYMEGMAAPMGDFQNYRREPRAVLIVDRSLRETTSGVYTTTIKLPSRGTYDVAVLADSPRLSHCFEAAAEANPLLKEERRIAIRVQHLLKKMTLPVGENFPFTFKLIETATDKARDGLSDVRVLTMLASGTWQRRDTAKSLGDGVYEINLNLPETGFYLVFVESASMRVQFRDLPYATLQATDEKVTPAAASSPSQEAGKP